MSRKYVPDKKNYIDRYYLLYFLKCITIMWSRGPN